MSSVFHTANSFHYSRPAVYSNPAETSLLNAISSTPPTTDTINLFWRDRASFPCISAPALFVQATQIGDSGNTIASGHLTFGGTGYAEAGRSVANSYSTTWNSAFNQESRDFWFNVAMGFFQLANQQMVHAAHWPLPAFAAARQGISSSVWATLLTNVIQNYTPYESEQQDIVRVIENSLNVQGSEYPSTPRNLLRACAVGAVISATIPERPHLYSAPEGRIILDYAWAEGRVATVVTDKYIQLLGDFDGELREQTIIVLEDALTKVRDWIEYR